MQDLIGDERTKKYAMSMCQAAYIAGQALHHRSSYPNRLQVVEFTRSARSRSLLFPYLAEHFCFNRHVSPPLQQDVSPGRAVRLVCYSFLEVLLMELEGPLSSQNHFLWRGHGSSPYSLRDRFEMLMEGLSPGEYSW